MSLMRKIRHRTDESAAVELFGLTLTLLYLLIDYDKDTPVSRFAFHVLSELTDEVD